MSLCTLSFQIFQKHHSKEIVQNRKQSIIPIFYTNFLSCRTMRSSTTSHWASFNFSKLFFINQCFLCYTGIYQLKRARLHAEECSKMMDINEEVNYNIQCCRGIPNIMRVPSQSAYVTRTLYHPVIRFSSDYTCILDW